MDLSRISDKFERLLMEGSDYLAEHLNQERHRVMVTGLSRSGKSVFFTSLMTLLYNRQQGQDLLPLLHSLPVSRIQSVALQPLSGEDQTPTFPIAQNLEALENGQWPPPTDQAYGFELVVKLRHQSRWRRLLSDTYDVVFEFYDYPGEWLTDLPMLQQDYVSWSHQVNAQLSTHPQKALAKDWWEAVEHFNFDVAPDNESIAFLIRQYRDFLQKAKEAGITLLQPSIALLNQSEYDFEQQGFVPLPTRVSSDIRHPWFLEMQTRYQHYQKTWLEPLKARYFNQQQNQVVLVDLFEGLQYGKSHLLQMKEALSNLAKLFRYGNQRWWQKTTKIQKVVFAATKVDLVPPSQHSAVLSLLKEITAGARAQIASEPVKIYHQLIAALPVVQPLDEHRVLFQNEAGEELVCEIQPIPSSLANLPADEHYILPQPALGKGFEKKLQHAYGMDELLQILLDEALMAQGDRE
jgi:predicted YcjX-like family ATPase